MKMQLRTVLLSLAFFPSLAICSDDALIVIVNSENPAAQVSPEELTDYFLKRKRAWPDGSSVRFIDRADDSPEKLVFLDIYVKKTGREVDLFWIGQKLYSGDSAPMQVSSDSMAALLVSRFKGAIGYVSSAFSGSKSVKKVEVRR